MKNTLISYTYRCGGNYKYHGDFVLNGELPSLQAEELVGVPFIPEQLEVGMENLTPEKWDSELDHPWHEIVCVETTDREDTDTSAEAFHKKFINTEWDEKESCNYLGNGVFGAMP